MGCCKEKKDHCRNPRQMKGNPGDCFPEQIRKCHGDSKQHTWTGGER